MTQLLHKDQDIKQAYNLYEGFLADEKARLAYESHLKWVNDQVSREARAEIRGKIEVAKILLKKGISVEIVSESTGLTVDEISKL